MFIDMLPPELRYELSIYFSPAEMKILYTLSCFSKLLYNDNRSKYYYMLNASYNNNIPLSLLYDKDLKYLKRMSAHTYRGLRLLIPAIACNYVDIVKYLRSVNRIYGPSIPACEREAAKRGNIEIFELLEDVQRTKLNFYDSYVKLAANNNEWTFVEYYISKTDYRITTNKSGQKLLKTKSFHFINEMS